ncbi:MAG TPA: hypothetical protein VGR16_14610 [Thermomicrobiales bacterium]|nr:hypothetical protein [Thermomicrobiales bacterium]
MARRSSPPLVPATEAALDRLDRLEEVLELMDELGVTTRAEAEALLAELEAAMDDDDESR